MWSRIKLLPLIEVEYSFPETLGGNGVGLFSVTTLLSFILEVSKNKSQYVIHNGKLQPYLKLYYNGSQVNELDFLLKEGDKHKVKMISSLSGG